MTALVALLALGLGDPESDIALPRSLVEIDLSEKIWIDSDFRGILMQKPKNFSGDSADFLQITIGVNFRIG